jgi:Lsr2
MAQKVQILYIDDIDGSEAEGTVRFGLDGTAYEIDLSTAHSDELRSALQTYIAHARKVGGTRRAARGGRRTPTTIDSQAVRAWAKEQGIEIKDRGRVPANIVAQYREATGR